MFPPFIWDNWPTSNRDKMMGMYPSVLRKNILQNKKPEGKREGEGER